MQMFPSERLLNGYRHCRDFSVVFKTLKALNSHTLLKEHIMHIKILSYLSHKIKLCLNAAYSMASRFSFYSFPGYEFLISKITFFDINNLIIEIKN